MSLLSYDNFEWYIIVIWMIRAMYISQNQFKPWLPVSPPTKLSGNTTIAIYLLLRTKVLIRYTSPINIYSVA